MTAEKKKLRFAVVGTGFWSHFQVAAWKELEGVELVALYNRTLAKAQALAKTFGVKAVYDDIEELFAKHELDFVDIITDVDTHLSFTKKAAENGLDVVCQKPMAGSLRQAQEMLSFCESAGVKLFVHENFRWQAPIRELKKALDSGVIGSAFKARLSFCSGFPVFDNQPFLAELEHFIIADVGSHVLDISRFLFGEMQQVYCVTKTVNKKIKGEDVANIQLVSKSGLHCFVELSYASILEKESFPQTLVLIEGDKGSLRLDHDFELKVTTRQGTNSQVVQPVMYPWVDPSYAVVHSSIVDCNRDILDGLQGGNAETTGQDNLKTVELVWAAYESASKGKIIRL
jgi:predicted dehydrogenase